jgi:hypothetical protein
MLKSTLITGSIILAVIYVAFGDKIEFLPEKMQTTSLQTRTSITKFAQGLVPGWAKKNPNERTEKEIEEQLEQGGGEPAN